jgi:hypothetical protein
MIQVQLAILADAANITNDNKLNILGEFNILGAAEPPWTILRRCLAVRLIGDATDEGSHTVGLRVLDQDRNLVWSTNDRPLDFPRAKIPGTPARFLIVTELPPVVLHTEGPHELEILVDGTPRGSVDFYCVLMNLPGRAG